MKPACCPPIRFMRKYQTPTNSRSGKIQEKRSRRKVDSISPLKETGYCSSILERSGSTRIVLKGLVSLGAPSTFIFPWI